MPKLDSAHLPAPQPLYIDQRTLIDECCIYVFFTVFGYCVSGWGGVGAPKRVLHSLLMQFFSLYNSKMEVSEAYFFDMAKPKRTIRGM